MDEHIKILQVVPELGYGGVEKIVQNYYEYLDHEKYTFDFVTHGGKELFHDRILDNGSKIFYFPTIGKGGLKEYKQQIRKGIDLSEYAVIHIHTGHVTGLYAKAYRDCGAKKIISHAHLAKCPNPKQKILMPFLRIMTKIYSDKLVACGNDAGMFCFGNSRFQVIPNGIDFSLYESITNDDINELKKKLGINDKTFVVGHIGRFSKQKNHAFLTEIVHDYVKINHNVKFVFVGDGPDRDYIENIVRTNGDSDNVLFVGIRDDVPKLMKMFDVFVLPSLFEGLPIVSIEAQAAGTACVISDTIDKTLDIGLELVSFLPIDNGPEAWSSALTTLNSIRSVKKADEDIHKALENCGYDIRTSARILKGIYDDIKE